MDYVIIVHQEYTGMFYTAFFTATVRLGGKEVARRSGLTITERDELVHRFSLKRNETTLRHWSGKVADTLPDLST